MYYYLGNERLQLGFFSPNVAAAFLVVTSLLTAGALLFAIRRRGIYSRIGFGLLGAALAAQFFMLAATYSRGGYVACLCALTAAAMVYRKIRGWILPVLFLVILLFTANGLSRIKSIGDIANGSIRHRFLIWHYGTGVVAKNWRTGTQEPGFYYTKYYQPQWLNESYHALINDSLTIAARNGIFVLFLIVAILGLLLQYGFKLYLVTRNELLLYAIAALAGYAIAGIFTMCYYFTSILLLLGGLVFIIAAFIIWGVANSKFRQSKFDLWPPLLAAALYCLIILGYGVMVNASLCYTWGEESLGIPQPRNSQGTFIFLGSASEFDFRKVLRSAAEHDFNVVLLPVSKGFSELEAARQMIKELLRNNSTPGFLIGIGKERALQAVALADISELAAVASINPPEDWPFIELSPKEKLINAKVPVFLFFNIENTKDRDAFLKLADSTPTELKIMVFAENQETSLSFISEQLSCFQKGNELSLPSARTKNSNAEKMGSNGNMTDGKE